MNLQALFALHIQEEHTTAFVRDDKKTRHQFACTCRKVREGPTARSAVGSHKMIEIISMYKEEKHKFVCSGKR